MSEMFVFLHPAHAELHKPEVLGTKINKMKNLQSKASDLKCTKCSKQTRVEEGDPLKKCREQAFLAGGNVKEEEK